MVTVFNKPISNETNIMTGATSEAAGHAGLVPAPAIGDQSKVLTGAGIWGLPGVVTINGRAPNPVTGDIVVIEGGGSSSYGSYRLDATITPSDWVANNGVYVAVVTNQYITSGMDGSETWLDNEYAQLGDAEFVSDTGTLTITTTIQPTENWNLHATLAVNGADVLADVSAIRTNITEITTNLGSPSSASGVTGADAFSKINTINNLVGAVPSGETVESQIASLNSKLIQKTTVTGTTDASGNIGSFSPTSRLIIGAYPDRTVNAEVMVVFVTTTASGAAYMLRCLNSQNAVVANANVAVVVSYINL